MSANDTTSASPETPAEAQTAAVAKAVAAIGAATQMQVTAPGSGDGYIEPTVFDRHGFERRVLGFITEEVNVEAFGSRNTLAALTYDLMGDPHTTHPPATHGALDIVDRPVSAIAQDVLTAVDRLKEAGLVSEDADGTYHVTEAGVKELQAGAIPAEIVDMGDMHEPEPVRPAGWVEPADEPVEAEAPSQEAPAAPPAAPPPLGS